MLVATSLLMAPSGSTTASVEPPTATSFCSTAHHVEWWRECAVALLRLAEKRPSDQHCAGTICRWVPQGEFAQEFVARCEELRSLAAEEGRPMAQGRWSAEPHDVSECPCTSSEHERWAEECAEDVQALLPGMKRWEVMDRFKLDGGVHDLGANRLRHPRCWLLKVDVTFDMGPEQFDRKPGDLVESVNGPYLEFLTYD